MPVQVPVSDEAIDRVGALLEQLGVRFELVLEAVSGFGGRLDALREELRREKEKVAALEQKAAALEERVRRAAALLSGHDAAGL